MNGSFLTHSAGKARCSCALRKNAIPQTRSARQLPLHKGALGVRTIQWLPLMRELSAKLTEGETLAVSSTRKFMLTKPLSFRHGSAVPSPSQREVFGMVGERHTELHYSTIHEIDTAYTAG